MARKKAANDENRATNKSGEAAGNSKIRAKRDGDTKANVYTGEKRVYTTRSSTQNNGGDTSPHLARTSTNNGKEDGIANIVEESEGATVATNEKPKNAQQTRAQPKPRPLKPLSNWRPNVEAVRGNTNRVVSEDDISTATVPIPSVSQTMDRPTQNGKKATIENESEAFDPPANSADTDNMERRSPLEMEVVSLSDKRADEDITMANYNLANDLAASVGDYDKIVRDFDNEFSEPGRPNAGEGGSDEENGDGHLRDAESDTVEKQTKTKVTRKMKKLMMQWQVSFHTQGIDHAHMHSKDLDQQIARSAQGKDVLEKHREKTKSEGHARKQDKGLKTFVARKESTVSQTKVTRKESNGRQAQSGQAAPPEVRKVQAASERQGKRSVQPSMNSDSELEGQRQPVVKKQRRRRTTRRNAEDEERQEGDNNLGYYTGPTKSVLESATYYLRLFCFTYDAFMSPANVRDISKKCFRDACVDIYEQDEEKYPRYCPAFKSLLAKEPWSMRGKIKVLAKAIVTSEYDIHPPDLNGPQYAHLTPKMKERKRLAAVRSKDDKDGKDGMPFGHPAIKMLIHRFAFNTASKPAPLVFVQQDWLNPIPFGTIALAVLALHNSLSEYAKVYGELVSQLRKLSHSSTKKDMLADWQREVYEEGIEKCSSYGGSHKQLAAIYVPSSDAELDDAGSDF
ncbi:hypothetical protein DFH11DRAFT_1548970 [Phellopilus nigrolimitatus]|nr:hypothetical protein DFH11DRAFT_1548970 [Phellopilus nigrolimitatus]